MCIAILVYSENNDPRSGRKIRDLIVYMAQQNCQLNPKGFISEPWSFIKMEIIVQRW